MISKKLLSKIKHAQTVSFDIFDTLLLRPYTHPEDLFWHIERTYGVPGFAKWRISAEREFYSRFGTTRQANINDIYSVAGHYADLRDVEMEWEKRILTANPEMRAAFDYAIASGRRVIISSDMYLPLEFIESVLQKNGFVGYDKIYLSNAINCRKDRGDMYAYIADDLGVPPKNILHIGDNRFSDYVQAKHNGFNAYLYARVVDKYMASDSRAALFYNKKSDLGASIITAMCASRGADDDYWADFGYSYAGPLVYAYARWIYNTAINCGLKKILFVARDGYIVQKVFDLISNGKIASEYVYAPRILNYTANLDYDPLSPEQPRIICDYFKCDTGGMAPVEYIEKHLSEFRQMAACEKQRTGYADYIAAATSGYSIVGVVDTISGQMSAQKLIEKESGIRTHGFYWLTIPGRKCISDFKHSDFLSDKEAALFQKANRCDLMELIFSAPENPTVTLHAGRPVYQDVLDPAEKKRYDICRRMGAGVLAFAKDAVRLFADNDLYISWADAFDLIDVYVSNPRNRDIHAMFDVKKSPYADNSLYEPLFAAPVAPWKISETSRLIWRTPLQNVALIVSRPLRIRARGLKRIRIFILPGIRTRILKLSLFDKYRVLIGGDND